MDIRVSMYVGPTSVDYFAKRAAALGYRDILEGTEHIIFTVPFTPKGEDIVDCDIFKTQIAETLYGRPVAFPYRNVSILRVSADES